MMSPILRDLWRLAIERRAYVMNGMLAATALMPERTTDVGS